MEKFPFVFTFFFSTILRFSTFFPRSCLVCSVDFVTDSSSSSSSSLPSCNKICTAHATRRTKRKDKRKKKSRQSKRGNAFSSAMRASDRRNDSQRKFKYFLIFFSPISSVGSALVFLFLSDLSVNSRPAAFDVVICFVSRTNFVHESGQVEHTDVKCDCGECRRLCDCVCVSVLAVGLPFCAMPMHSAKSQTNGKREEYS